MMPFCNKLLPDYAREVTKEELVTHFDAKFLKAATQTMLPDSISWFGMRPDTWDFATEWMGYGSIRVQIAGFQVVAMFPARPTAVALGLDPDSASMHMITDAICACKEFEPLFEIKGVAAGTVGPSTALIVPPGYIVLSKTIGLSTVGFKRTFMPGTAESLNAARDIIVMKGSPKGGLLSLEAMKKIVGINSEVPSITEAPLGVDGNRPQDVSGNGAQGAVKSDTGEKRPGVPGNGAQGAVPSDTVVVAALENTLASPPEH